VNKIVGVLENVRPLGYTPLSSRAEGEVLKYDFKGVGPKAWDKSGHGNRGTLKPRDDPPRRKILFRIPPDVALALDGENDYVTIPLSPEDVGVPYTVSVRVKMHSLGGRQCVLTARNRFDGICFFGDTPVFRARLGPGNYINVRGPHVSLDEWNKIRAVAYQKNRRYIAELYVNDELVDSGSSTRSPDPHHRNYALGRQGTDDEEYSYATVSEARIFKRAVR